MKWFRLHAEAIDDDKLNLLAFEDRWHFVAIMCLKCQGVLDSRKHLDRRVAMKLGLQIKDADEVRRRLMELGLINKNWQPAKWNSRQYVSDNSTERVRKYRSKMERSSNVSETPPDTDTDTDTERDRDETKKPAKSPRQKAVKKQKRAQKIPDDFEPTNQTLVWFGNEGLSIDHVAEHHKFVDHWKANGKTFIDWQAVWRNWMRRADEYAKARTR